MDFRNAFVLWRGLGVDYEGGVLASPARVAIHFTHRLGAIVAGSVLILTGLLVLARSAWPPLRLLGGLLVFAVLLQVAIGVSMVHLHMPLPVATLHNAGAAFLVIVMVTLLRMLWPRPPEPAAGMLPLRRVDTPR